jgi:hypothetical protein
MVHRSCCCRESVLCVLALQQLHLRVLVSNKQQQLLW